MASTKHLSWAGAASLAAGPSTTTTTRTSAAQHLPTPPPSPEKQAQTTTKTLCKGKDQARVKPKAGTIMFCAEGTEVLSSASNAGRPSGHPLLVLPTTSQGCSPDAYVDCLLLTSINVVQKAKNDEWASFFVPVEPQRHPYRSPVFLAPGSDPLLLPSSINIGATLTVPINSLSRLRGGVFMSEAALKHVMELRAERVAREVERAKAPVRTGRTAHRQQPWGSNPIRQQQQHEHHAADVTRPPSPPRSPPPPPGRGRKRPQPPSHHYGQANKVPWGGRQYDIMAKGNWRGTT